MSPALRLRRLEAIAELLEELVASRHGADLGSALDALLDATSAIAAIAFTRTDGAEPAAQRRLERPLEEEPVALRRGLFALAERAMVTGSEARISDVLADRQGIDDATQAATFGARALIAIPLAGSRAHGAIVVLFADAAMLDEESLSYMNSVARIMGIALECDERAQGDAHVRDELMETGRLASLALCTSSVAHDLHGPSGALVLQHEELSRIAHQLAVLAGPNDVQLSGSVAELGDIVGELGDAVGRLRSTLVKLTRLGQGQAAPEPLDMGEVLRGALSVVRPYLERRGVVVKDRIEAGCFTVGLRDHLAQVALNLVMNAADAAKTQTPPRIWVALQRDRHQIRLSVDDNGPGVDPKSVGHIFRPFFTTKEHGTGAGLGLSVCSDVVASHGGHIEVDRRTEGGASFRVILPRSAPNSRRAASGSEPSRRPGPVVRRVLLVDDDPVFSRSMRRALKPHDVRTAATASEAQIALLDPSYDPDLVVCDVLLPGANGNVLHERIQQQRPAIAARFVFVTGGALGKDEADYLRESGCPTLLKPLEVASLLDLLEETPPESANAVRTLVRGSSSKPR